MMALILLFLFHVEAKQVCAPKTDGASFSLGCKLVSEDEAQRLQAESNEKRGIKEKSPATKIGMHSGKPGFYIMEEDRTIDAIIMNEKVSDKLHSLFAKIGTGETTECELDGLHQSIGYTIFKVIDCK